MPVAQPNYNSLTTGVINYLRANSATLDTGMYASVTTIRDFRTDEYSLWGTLYPAISVDLISMKEDQSELSEGLNARRPLTLSFQIGCHIRTIQSYTAVRTEMRRLVSNVEHALRQDTSFSGTTNYSAILGTEFGSTVRGQNGNWQKSAVINLEITEWI